MKKLCISLLLSALVSAANAQHDHSLDNRWDMSRAPILTGLGDIHHPVSTKSEMAQKFFDQGLSLAYGFNHVEAERAFVQAQKLDPGLAMAWWGQALVLGPNLNDPITPEREGKAYEASRHARKLARKALGFEKDLIEALERRYSNERNPDRAKLDKAYSDAMRSVAKRYPDDPDTQTIYAASLMEAMPWDYYEANGEPKPDTKVAIAIFEDVIKRWPKHTGAHHFYIHAVEASSTPDRALPSAEVLGGLAPAAGHLVHMPSHIWVRVGQYEAASEANRQAVLADESYITQCHAQGIYPVLYYPHNLHMLTYAAGMQGSSQEAISASKKLVEKVPADKANEMPQLGNLFVTLPMVVQLTFGRWDEVISFPQPNAKLLVANATWHYARGVALARQNRVSEAEKELPEIIKIAADPDLPNQHARRTDGEKMVAITQYLLEGEIAAARKDYDAAVGALEKAVAAQDALTYSEPENWYFPTRDTLGAVLLDGGRPADAERVYRKDLELHRGNGWSLYGLVQSLRAQGKNDDAEQAMAQFSRAWVHADVSLMASRF